MSVSPQCEVTSKARLESGMDKTGISDEKMDPTAIADRGSMETGNKSNKVCGGRCACLAGCYGMLVLGFYCFIIVPAGAVLIIHGVNKHNDVTLGVGIGLLILFVIVIPILYTVWKCCCSSENTENTSISPDSNEGTKHVTKAV